MSVPVVAFFNNKGGVGKTSLVYHLAWMYSLLGVRVVAADLDPQANLTAAFLDDERLEQMWPDDGTSSDTIEDMVRPLMENAGDIRAAHVELLGEDHGLPGANLGLVAGDMALASHGPIFSEAWMECLRSGSDHAFRVTSAFSRLLQSAAVQHRATLVLMDVGRSLGAISRAALLAADYVVVPVVPDLFAAPGLRNVGSALDTWRRDWRVRVEKAPDMGLQLPAGTMVPLGYVVMQHVPRMTRPVRAYDGWAPYVYRTHVLQAAAVKGLTVRDDPECLAVVKRYTSLMPLAQEAHKPMFALKPADGAIGAHQQAVLDAYWNFKELALAIAARIGVPIPS